MPTTLQLQVLPCSLMNPWISPSTSGESSTWISTVLKLKWDRSTASFPCSPVGLRVMKILANSVWLEAHWMTFWTVSSLWQYEQTICAMLLGKPCTIASTSLTALGYSPAEALTAFLDETLNVSKTRWWSQLITACELVKDDCPSMTWSCNQLISLWEGSRYCTLMGTGWGGGREALSNGFDLVIRTVECPTTVTPSSLNGRAFGAGTVELDAAAVEDDASRRGPLRNLSGRFGIDCPCPSLCNCSMYSGPLARMRSHAALSTGSPNGLAFSASCSGSLEWTEIVSFADRLSMSDKSSETKPSCSLQSGLSCTNSRNPGKTSTYLLGNSRSQDNSIELQPVAFEQVLPMAVDAEWSLSATGQDTQSRSQEDVCELPLYAALLDLSDLPCGSEGSSGEQRWPQQPWPETCLSTGSYPSMVPEVAKVAYTILRRRSCSCSETKKSSSCVALAVKLKVACLIR